MLEGARVAVVVPARNEARHIGRVLRRMPPFVDRICVVDDGSTDGTGRIVASVGDPRVRLIRHEHPRGVGAALSTGYDAALEDAADVVAVMAGDDQMDPADLRRVAEPVALGMADYCKGDRLSYPDARTHMPWTRWLGNHVLSWCTRRATGLAIRDSQCGYTAISRRALQHIDPRALWPGYGYPNDVLGKLACSGQRVQEVTVRPVYAGEQSGIRLSHVLLVIPRVLLSVAIRRWTTARRGRARLARTAGP